MLFNSFEFLAFFAVVGTLYILLSHRMQNVLLLGASYVFYGAWDWRFLGLIWVSTGVDFFVGQYIERHRGTKKARLGLAASVMTNLSILGFFKYWGFFIENLEVLFGTSLAGSTLQVIVPVGISFYTFQTMSYTIDVYRDRMPATSNLLDFALFVAFFPQLVAGPIERAAHLLPQVSRPRTLSWERMSTGAHLAIWGLFKKCVIADNLAVLVVDPIFDPDVGPGGWAILVGTYAFAFQIYCDFSGYSDIAIGIARMLGFDFRKNFDLPYFAISPSDFWRRWHISLSTWLRDYLYIPLGGNRTGSVHVNLMVTMLLGGLWHGASWTFVIWGLYHGLLLIVFRLDELGPKLWARLSADFRIILMFQLTCIGWLIFRAESGAHLARLVTGFFDEFFITYDTDLMWTRYFLLFAGPLLLIQKLQQVRSGRLIDLVPVPMRGFVYAAGLYIFIVLGEFGSREFIYFQF